MEEEKTRTDQETDTEGNILRQNSQGDFLRVKVGKIVALRKAIFFQICVDFLSL